MGQQPHDWLFDSHHSLYPSMPKARRRRHHDRRIVRKRLETLGVSEEAMQQAYSTIYYDRKDGVLRRECGIAPGMFRKTGLMQAWYIPGAIPVPSKKEKAKRIGKAPIHEVYEQIEEIIEEPTGDLDHIVEWLVSEGWPRRNAA